MMYVIVKYTSMYVWFRVTIQKQYFKNNEVIHECIHPSILGTSQSQGS